MLLKLLSSAWQLPNYLCISISLSLEKPVSKHSSLNLAVAVSESSAWQRRKYLTWGCPLVGVETRKLAVDGFPGARAIGVDLNQG